MQSEIACGGEASGEAGTVAAGVFLPAVSVASATAFDLSVSVLAAASVAVFGVDFVACSFQGRVSDCASVSRVTGCVGIAFG